MSFDEQIREKQEESRRTVVANTAEVQIWRIRLRRATTALAALAAFGLGVVAIPSAKAQSVSVLYSFAGAPDGINPNAALIRDKAGNLYGTTLNGGASGLGTVFKLDTSGNETLLHSFTGSNGDGALPSGGLTMDKAGNLYGTTSYGGAGACGFFGLSGCGTVFKLDTSGSETVLYSFTGSGGDGAVPSGGLILDKAGNLYGTTFGGGAGTCSLGCGTVFKLDTSGNETVLHSFTGGDGAGPVAGLIMDKAGNLYGVTAAGGTTFISGINSGDGTVFKLDTSGNETVLHSFANSPDGTGPDAGLIMDKAGNLYSTTVFGGASYYGTVFKLDTSGNETVLYNFTGPPSDGAYPAAALVMDKAGNLYGTTPNGGASSNCFVGCGTVFKLDTSGIETVQHSFTDSGGDGAKPFAGLIMDKAGNLYGTTYTGGASGYGSVFELVP
jgi:uncharacterized repeat protein (TIGR03803 family)